MKKMLSLIMSLLVMASFCISTNAVAFDETNMLDLTGSHSEGDFFCGDFCYHILDDGTAEITEYIGNKEVLVIPDTIDGYSVTSIRNGSFEFAEYLKTVYCGTKISNIGSSAFQNGGITIVDGSSSRTFDYGLENIFVDKSNMHYFDIDGVLFSTDTKEIVFYPSNNKAEYLTVPDGIKKVIIGGSLREIIIPSSVESIVYLDGSSYGGRKLEKIMVSQDSQTYCSIDGILYSKDMTELLWIPEMNPIEDYIIPETITEIKCTPFSRNMKNLRIHKGITQTNMDYELSCVYAYDNMENFIVDNDNPYYYSIGGILYWKKPDLYRETRFAYPPSNKSLSFKIPDKTTLYMDNLSLNHVKYLENLILPESMKTFSAQSVCLLKNLKSITVEEGNEYYTSIDGILYSQDMKRLICYPKGRIESSYTIPDGITTIESYALISTVNLKEIIFPESVIEINDFPGYETTMWIAMNLQKVDGFIIKGYRNTIAEIYAEENGFKFISIGDVERLLGDSDGDGNITILDATVIQRHLASIPTAVYIEAAADADQDGSVTIIDATAIQRWLVQLPTNENIGKVMV